MSPITDACPVDVAHGADAVDCDGDGTYAGAGVGAGHSAGVGESVGVYVDACSRDAHND